MSANSANQPSNLANDGEWRLDHNWKVIKSASEFNFFRTEFYEIPRARPTTVNVIFRELRRAVRDDIHALLDDVKFGTHNVKLIERSGIKSFHVDLINKDIKQEFITTVMQAHSKVITVYPLVQDLTKVTVGGLSWEISDSEVLKYLSNFGDFSRLPKDITYCKDGRGYWSGERVYTANNIAIEIPSYSTVFGKLLTIRYKDQPPTCRLCDSRDHKGFDCPLNPNLRRRNHRDSTSVMNGSSASQDNSNSTQIGEPVKDASQSTGGQGDIANVQKDQDDAASVQNMQNGNLAKW